jgi:Fe-S cluster biogenesis protein NfuA
MTDNTETSTAPEHTDGAAFEAKVRSTIEKVRPFLQADGGDIEIVAIEGRDVKVRLQGACKGCPGATYTLKLGVEAALRRDIPDFGNLIPVE